MLPSWWICLWYEGGCSPAGIDKYWTATQQSLLWSFRLQVGGLAAGSRCCWGLLSEPGASPRTGLQTAVLSIKPLFYSAVRWFRYLSPHPRSSIPWCCWWFGRRTAGSGKKLPPRSSTCTSVALLAASLRRLKSRGFTFLSRLGKPWKGIGSCIHASGGELSARREEAPDRVWSHLNLLGWNKGGFFAFTSPEMKIRGSFFLRQGGGWSFSCRVQAGFSHRTHWGSSTHTVLMWVSLWGFLDLTILYSSFIRIFRAACIYFKGWLWWVRE